MAAWTMDIVKTNGAVDYNLAAIRVSQWLQGCHNGTYTLTLKRKVMRRSISQNSLMWLWFNIIADNWSEANGRTFTAGDVHDAYCIMLIPKDTPRGRIAGSTRELTTEQMTEFLNKVQADAQTEYGITLPNPEDQNFEAWLEQYENQ